MQIGSPVSHAAYDNVPLLSVTRTFGGHVLFSLLLPFVLHRWILRTGVHRLLFPVGPGGVFHMMRPPVAYDAIVYHTYLQQWQAVPGQRWKRIFVPLERRTLRRAQRVFCFCEDTARVLREEMGIAGERISVLPHAIHWGKNDRAAIYRGCTESVMPGLCVCIARLEERKGVRVLLEAWKDVIKSIPNARLVIVGSGAQARKIDRMISSIKGNSAQRIVHIPQADLERLVSSAQVAVCPSYLEGFGLAAAEAMMAGTVVVASDVDGLRALIDHERTGLLVRAGDAGALAQAIVRLLRDDALRNRLAEAAAREARLRFDPMHAADAVVDVMRCCTI